MGQISKGRAYCSILAVIGFLAAGCSVLDAGPEHSVRAEWRRSYDLQTGGDVSVRNVNGRIRVEPATGRSLEIVAEKVGRGSSEDRAKDALDRIEIQEDVTPSSVHVETKFHRTGGSRDNWEVAYTVRLPSGAKADFSTVNGGLVVSGVSGAMRVHTTNGGITARDITGSIDATTTNGGIDVDLIALRDAVTAECTNGGITLRIPADAKATLSAATVNGGIRTTGLKLQVRDWNRRRLEADVNGGGTPIRLRGVNGGVTVSDR